VEALGAAQCFPVRRMAEARRLYSGASTLEKCTYKQEEKGVQGECVYSE
jgi:hypothetical protein